MLAVNEKMKKEELIKKIIEKKEFSRLPKKDVDRVFEKFDKESYSDEEKVKKTRWFLKKNYSGFTSQKILSLKDKEPEWILRKHLSTRERLPHYKKIYKRLIKKEGVTVFDFGAGVNGFSYKFFPLKIFYIAVEAVGQLVDLMNYYFKTRGLEGMAIFESLFELDKIKKYLGQVKGEKIVFLFKVLDSLESIERNYSKKLLLEIVPLVDEVVISFATESMIKRKKIWVKRTWILKFIGENFKIIDDFKVGSERFIVLRKK